MSTEQTWPPYMADPDVQRALLLAELAAGWAIKELGIPMRGTQPDHLAVTAFWVTHEHHASVIHLTKFGHMASAHALMRPAFESYVRGLWLTCADDKQLEHYQKGHDSADPERMIRLLIERTGDDQFTDLLDTWMESKKSLHGFTHHKFQSLVRRSGEIDIPHSEVVNMLRFSTGMALHASQAIVGLARDRVPEAEVATRPTLIARLQGELIGMFEGLNLVSRSVVAA